MPKIPSVIESSSSVIGSYLYPDHSFEWRQTDQEVVVSLLVKNVTPNKVEVDVQKREVLPF